MLQPVASEMQQDGPAHFAVESDVHGDRIDRGELDLGGRRRTLLNSELAREQTLTKSSTFTTSFGNDSASSFCIALSVDVVDGGRGGGLAHSTTFTKPRVPAAWQVWAKSHGWLQYSNHRRQQHSDDIVIWPALFTPACTMGNAYALV